MVVPSTWLPKQINPILPPYTNSLWARALPTRLLGPQKSRPEKSRSSRPAAAFVEAVQASYNGLYDFTCTCHVARYRCLDVFGQLYVLT